MTRLCELKIQSHPLTMKTTRIEIGILVGRTIVIVVVIVLVIVVIGMIIRIVVLAMIVVIIVLLGLLVTVPLPAMITPIIIVGGTFNCERWGWGLGGVIRGGE